MSRTEVLDIFKELAKGQVYYERLLYKLNKVDENVRGRFLDEYRNCKTPVDVIIQTEEC